MDLEFQKIPEGWILRYLPFGTA